MKSLQLTKPHMLVVVGIPGSGKTFFAEQFSKTFSAPFVHLQALQELVGDQKTAQSVWDYTVEQLVLTKQTIIIEGEGNTRSDRQFLATFARTHGYQPLFIWVQTEPLTAQLRATKQTPGQKPRTIITERVFEDATKNFETLNGTEKYMVISGKHTYASQAKNVLKKLVEPRTEHAKQHTVAQPRTEETRETPPPRPGRISIN